MFKQCLLGPERQIFQNVGTFQKGLLPKICHTYPTMMKLGSYTLPKEDPKNI